MTTFEQDLFIPGEPAAIFALLADPGRLAPCLPGVTLDPRPTDAPLAVGDELGGTMQVRLGPISAKFRGAVRVLELDQEALRTVLGASAEDERGNGSGLATITTSVSAGDGGSVVRIVSELELRGRIMQFGASAVERVSARMLEQFAGNLATTLQGGEVGTSTNGSGPTPATPPRALAGPTPAGRPLHRTANADFWPLLATCLAFLCGLLIGRGRAASGPLWSARKR
ncbi:MAG: hypothetical protein JWO02_3033 [Solirubrobacterales bacterium]|nr:hypothetical protein [Solirubrobacterales bacterium]